MPQISAVAQLVKILGGTNGQALFAYAKTQIGRVKSGIKAPIMLGCVEAVNHVFSECFGVPIDQSVGTTALYNTLVIDKRFVQVDEGDQGDIVISYGYRNGPVTNGHVGIVSDGGKIMSNNSSNGMWDEHLNLQSWKDRYVTQGGYQVLYFRLA